MHNNIYEFELKDLSGKKVPMADYKGKVVLVVNIASACGLTPQLDGLQKLYERYRTKGLEILGFPSNEFAGQEPLEGDAIEQFCSVNYGVSFKIMHKGKVKGSHAQPLYRYLAEKTKILGVKKNYPVWNFQKYLIDRNGNVVDYFAPTTVPESDKITEAIEKCLAH